MYSTGYPEQNIHFIKGMVEDTIPESMPSQIALLRLDTDFYQSTYHELQHLFPLIFENGVLIIDDYGWWRGCREATDKYFQGLNSPVFLNRIGEGARLILKVGATDE